MVDWPTLSNDKKSVVTIGSFDGMHQGHQAVIRRVVELAKKEQSFSVVVLFDPRPALVHGYAAQNGGQEPPAGMIDAQALTSMQERLRAINKLGVDYTLIVRYTLAFAAKSYRFFLGQMVGKLGMRALVLGSDAARVRPCRRCEGHRESGARHRVFQLDVVDDRGPGETRVPANAKPVMPTDHGEPADPLEGASKAERRAWSKKNQAKAVRVWSSTNVRYLLGQGRIKDADAILGHPHAVEGRRGAWRGTWTHHRLPHGESERECGRLSAGRRRIRRLARGPGARRRRTMVRRALPKVFRSSSIPLPWTRDLPIIRHIVGLLRFPSAPSRPSTR